MFQFGMIFLFIGALMVYATGLIVRIIKRPPFNNVLFVKISGLVFTIIGAIMIFLSQYPEKLEFLRIV
ncbi:hypothetical protein [Alkaliphilus peptidifermentans]|uniref:Uncharacterized protein n=1 Tax=Alkaliphilus peptidifermentans DSM 18978 TaxID=1120976 RepID=A0A1G5I2L5_9FIRM|nr:hypothetical protein [Alkaliphilus peptidifermentans]SCY69618.1 hypothetical protein SAMN03080606_02194 [Alkaliphilus peptidifermentans DSM 18978]